MMGVMRAMCGLRGRYVRVMRAMRIRDAWDMWVQRTLWAGRGLCVGQPYENAKKSLVRGHNAHPPMRIQVTFLCVRAVADRVIAPTVLSSEKILYLCKKQYYENEN
jgi:hypothetical protein